MNTRPNILLVEDSDDDAYFFLRALKKSGIDSCFHRVSDGSEAIDFLMKSSASAELPEIIFLDLKLPILNGFEVLNWLEKQSFYRQMRVIVLSGSEHQSDKNRAAQMRATDYVVKPIKVSDLNRFLADVCPANMGAQV